MLIYPLKFLPIYHKKIWGGERLKQFWGRDLPGSCIGESWELSTRQEAMSRVSNGKFAGETLQELINRYPTEILGKVNDGKTFPLLHKIIDATLPLSVQIHPDDDYAVKQEGDRGKTEAWYVLYADDTAKIIYGLNPAISKIQLQQAIRDGKIMEVVRSVPIVTGDLIYIPAGTVHALCGGAVVYEVQQNSDITYRLYDYGRVDEKGRPRPLHIDKALEVVSPEQQLEDNFKRTTLYSPFFSITKVRAEGFLQHNTESKFLVVYMIDGEGIVAGERIQRGETVLIPACMGDFKIIGEFELLLIIP